ncbi:MAG: type II toxin-antitoxin system VapC family toxin [Kiritimatiellia bacterium]
MIALDTNVIVRFLIKDDEKQALCVYKRFKQAESKKERFFIPLPILLETLWVLESAYKIGRIDILNSLEALSQMPIIEFEANCVLEQLIIEGRNTNLDLSDILIAYASRNSGCSSVLTFDKKASRLSLFQLLE